eukprot:gnl/TRDRNA2_/TRDRNA2_135542_c0_seq1.p1 gnl/TRDRNA2_/TRDRNA2_135542_c0~~gnl/TRDRNA2_/TRDRNA2_135542_c0_seq1.p1  ORF type:complete len:389 (+),score=50.26 gnl/TRDRNA2_/TRDRNA2_135542_c0_seq1:138-1304(+)
MRLEEASTEHATLYRMSPLVTGCGMLSAGIVFLLHCSAPSLTMSSQQPRYAELMRAAVAPASGGMRPQGRTWHASFGRLAAWPPRSIATNAITNGPFPFRTQELISRASQGAAQARQAAGHFQELPMFNRTAELLANVRLPQTPLQVKTAEYKSSATDIARMPIESAAPLAEFAFIGRSNVGKSSLINLITDRRKLALVSKKPGKTKCINHFLINGGTQNAWYLVDLPGYGYANLPKSMRRNFDRFTEEYFLKRKSLAHVFLLVDATVPVQTKDLERATWLHKNKIPYSLVFTKVDKSAKGQISSEEEHMAAFQLQVYKGLGVFPAAFITSASRRIGRKDLLLYLGGLCELWNAWKLSNRNEDEYKEQERMDMKLGIEHLRRGDNPWA